MDKQERTKRVVKALELTWASLYSHLPDDPPKPQELGCSICRGTEMFHKKCVREYAFVIGVLADML